MRETVTLVAQLNAGWRIVFVRDRPGCGRYPVWSIERLTPEGAWHGETLTRSSTMIRWCLPNVGPIDEAAQAIIDAMPQFTYRKDKANAAEEQRLKEERRAARLARATADRVAERAARRTLARAASRERDNAKRRAATVERRAVAALEAAQKCIRKARAPEKGTKRAAVAKAFLRWRAEQQEQVQ
jgi:hypothetical protein